VVSGKWVTLEVPKGLQCDLYARNPFKWTIMRKFPHPPLRKGEIVVDTFTKGEFTSSPAQPTA